MFVSTCGIILYDWPHECNEIKTRKISSEVCFYVGFQIASAHDFQCSAKERLWTGGVDE